MQRHLVHGRHRIILALMMNQLIWIETVPVADERDETAEKQNRGEEAKQLSIG